MAGDQEGQDDEERDSGETTAGGETVASVETIAKGGGSWRTGAPLPEGSSEVG